MKSPIEWTEHIRIRLEDMGGLKGSCKSPPVVTEAGLAVLKQTFEAHRNEVLDHAAEQVCHMCASGCARIRSAVTGDIVHSRGNLTKCLAPWRPLR